jgi:hypothetical protein
MPRDDSLRQTAIFVKTPLPRRPAAWRWIFTRHETGCDVRWQDVTVHFQLRLMKSFRSDSDMRTARPKRFTRNRRLLIHRQTVRSDTFKRSATCFTVKNRSVTAMGDIDFTSNRLGTPIAACLGDAIGPLGARTRTSALRSVSSRDGTTNLSTASWSESSEASCLLQFWYRSRRTLSRRLRCSRFR